MAEGNHRNARPGPPSWFDWRLLLWLLAAILVASYWADSARDARIESLTYSEFKQVVRQDEVARVTLEGLEIRGLYREGAPQANAAPPGRAFRSTRPPVEDSELIPLLEKHDVTIVAEPSRAAWWQRLLITLLPWVLLIGVLGYITYRFQKRMAQSAQGGLFGFGRSRARRLREAHTGVAMSDIAGAENAKRDLREVIDYLREPGRYTGLGAKIPRGVLLMGAPGTGKTLLARAVAGEAGVPFYSISGSEFIEMFVGVGASRVRDTFNEAKRESPAIVFIDELDSIGRARGAGLGGGHDEREQTLNQILSEMDGFEAGETVIVLAATNRPDVLDPALLRPGRFDRKVTLEPPPRDARRAILEVHTRDKPLANDVDLSLIAQRTVGFSGADLENLANEAALLAGREQLERIDMACFDRARDKIVLGDPREERLLDRDRELIAYHEAGHTLMAWLLPNADRPDKVTIIPRGQALGTTEQTPGEDRYNLTESQLWDRLGVMLGGRTAERLIFGEVSTGAESDLKQATDLARRMVAEWGMSEALGPSAFPRGSAQPFLGRDMSQGPGFSERTGQLIDREIRRLLESREHLARELMETHRSALEALARELLSQETLDAGAIERLLQPRAA